MNDLLRGSPYTKAQLHKTINMLRSLADDLESVCEGVLPAVPDVLVNDWFLQYKGTPCIVGKVSGHPIVKGDYIATTEVFFLSETLGLARTSSRWYRLGRQIDPDTEGQQVHAPQ